MPLCSEPSMHRSKLSTSCCAVTLFSAWWLSKTPVRRRSAAEFLSGEVLHCNQLVRSLALLNQILLIGFIGISQCGNTGYDGCGVDLLGLLRCVVVVCQRGKPVIDQHHRGRSQ